ncbi:hypothetical protein M0638_03620 [Roseomonas sp. NAR14]|uniref:Uncharacterized protein n=1 Tax=Roseomonas acroporae TaxID=2937791 RepID=A0A9X1Y771_9PROT|nr:hypothetical protein [Roseomonas acroporae]MCK8783470.1 hypothetical protein [Roseomonas acroporae]
MERLHSVGTATLVALMAAHRRDLRARRVADAADSPRRGAPARRHADMSRPAGHGLAPETPFAAGARQAPRD